MKIINMEVLYQGKVAESVIVPSFEAYRRLGGQRDILDVYALTKERAKHHEDLYISAMDQSLSGIPVPEEYIRKERLIAQVYWYILHLWFNKPLRKVSFSTFDLTEFNRI